MWYNLHRSGILPFCLNSPASKIWMWTKELFKSTEPEPESTHAAAQVLRPLLHPDRGLQHPTGGHEQRASSLCQDELQIWPEGIHLQEASVQEREGESQSDVQGSGLSGHARGGALLWHRDIQQLDEDPAERLSGRWWFLRVSVEGRSVGWFWNSRASFHWKLIPK